MRRLGGGWFLVEGDGQRVLYNSLSLRKRFLAPGEAVPDQLAPASPPGLPAPSMNVFQVVVTEACNLACDYCAAEGMRRRARSIPPDLVGEVLDTCGRLCGTPEPLFAVTGGEPLTAAETVRRLLREAPGKKVLFSNCTLLDSGWIRLLRETGTALVASLDGGRARHDSARRFPDGGRTWDRVVANLERAGEMGLSFGLSMVFRGREAGPFLEETASLVERLEPVSAGVNLMHSSPGFAGPDQSVYADVCAGLFALSRKTGLFVDQVARRLSPMVEERFRFRDCSAMGSKAVVFPDLSVSGCVNDPSSPPGSWSGRVPLLLEECRGCPAAGICGGGCAFDGDRLFEGGVDRRNCAWTLRLLREILLDMAASLPPGSPTPGELRREYGYMLSRGGSPLRSSLGHDG